jgi:hypothetical protein
MINVSNIVLPFPNPTPAKVSKLDFLVSLLANGGLRGVKMLWKLRLMTSQTTSYSKG